MWGRRECAFLWDISSGNGWMEPFLRIIFPVAAKMKKKKKKKRAQVLRTFSRMAPQELLITGIDYFAYALPTLIPKPQFPYFFKDCLLLLLN